jgi:hypothetical protein
MNTCEFYRNWLINWPSPSEPVDHFSRQWDRNNNKQLVFSKNIYTAYVIAKLVRDSEHTLNTSYSKCKNTTKHQSLITL